MTSRYEDAGWRPFWALRGRVVFMSPRLLLGSDPENKVGMPTCPESSDHHPRWDRLEWYHFLSAPVLPLAGPDLTVYTSWAPLLERVQWTAPTPSRHCPVNSKCKVNGTEMAKSVLPHPLPLFPSSVLF